MQTILLSSGFRQTLAAFVFIRQVREYFDVFWRRYKELGDWKKIIDKIERGERKIQVRPVGMMIRITNQWNSGHAQSWIVVIQVSGSRCRHLQRRHEIEQAIKTKVSRHKDPYNTLSIEYGSNKVRISFNIWITFVLPFHSEVNNCFFWGFRGRLSLKKKTVFFCVKCQRSGSCLGHYLQSWCSFLGYVYMVWLWLRPRLWSRVVIHPMFIVQVWPMASHAAWNPQSLAIPIRLVLKVAHSSRHVRCAVNIQCDIIVYMCMCCRTPAQKRQHYPACGEGEQG